MATVPTTIAASARGITRTLSGYIVQNETISEAPISETTEDQTGAVVAEEVYDRRTDLTLTVISASSTRTAPAGNDDIISYDDKNWKVDSIEEAGSYNGKLRFTIRAHRFSNYPTQPS